MSTNDRDYGAQVADLIEDAFVNLKQAHKTSPASPADLAGDHSMAQILAAQALATLGLASEVRAVGLLLAAGSSIGPSGELAREAFTAAATMLGLVVEEPVVDTDALDALRDALTGKDPADAGVEL